ncbi:hypothetical protein LO762_19015 [Actinocorallia sp. API 0066]|uniref:nucleotide exchange factor GrpE n=1 Tax=Actinocorallia sp. API 0066 TaxID=2896846 RepID=UPI001E32570D|nr:hypothetical protein [Actinocorallia sp. API 0066]MCD0451272.1 hypothetical protein [Actinocorallia sp. API 0066]
MSLAHEALSWLAAALPDLAPPKPELPKGFSFDPGGFLIDESGKQAPLDLKDKALLAPDGRIYNPESGFTYGSDMEILDKSGTIVGPDRLLGLAPDQNGDKIRDVVHHSDGKWLFNGRKAEGFDVYVNTQAEGVQPPRPVEDGGGFRGTVTLVTTLATGLVLGALLCWYALRDRMLPAARDGRPDAAEAERAWRAQRPERAAAERERTLLVRALIDLADRLQEHNPGLWRMVNRQLERVGVTVYTPDGERFDPYRHKSLTFRKTDVPEHNETIASTELVGYLDRGAVLREPEVVVYRMLDDDRVR